MKSSQIRNALLVALVSLSLIPVIEAAPRQFRAGAAKSNITPFLGGLIVGGWSPDPAKHIHDELWARCLVLDDGQTQIAIAVSDNVGISRDVFDEAKRMVHEKTGLPVENMLMSSTHTHSATSARGDRYIAGGNTLDEYQQFVAHRIADGIRRAMNNLEPARVGWANGHEPDQVFNRRYYMKPGTPLLDPFGGTDKVKMNPGIANPDVVKPAGPTDQEIPFISVHSEDGRPIALLANYSLHYVGGVGGAHISADYFGMFADRIQQLIGADRLEPPFVAMMSNGTSGDINNINVLGKRERREPYQKMREVAEDVAAAVYKAYQTVEYRDWVPLGMEQTEIELGVRVPSEDDVAYARKLLSKPESAPTRNSRERIYAQRTLQMAELPPSIPVIVQALRIGDVGIAAIPNEVFVEIGLEIKERSPLKPAFTISLANGSYGYLPTVKHHELGGYETWRGTNRLEIQAAPKIVEALLQLFDRLK
ncbi:MAG: neutral/alkaline non-lysosomal ceramidase N-terminal domain-containing protein [Acidobacteriota bacterium]